MKKINKLVTLLLLTATLSSSIGTLNAQDEYAGSGYVDSTSAPRISPTVALGTVALAAIIAVIVQNRNHHHGDDGFTGHQGGVGHGHGHAH